MLDRQGQNRFKISFYNIICCDCRQQLNFKLSKKKSTIESDSSHIRNVSKEFKSKKEKRIKSTASFYLTPGCDVSKFRPKKSHHRKIGRTKNPSCSSRCSLDSSYKHSTEIINTITNGEPEIKNSDIQHKIRKRSATFSGPSFLAFQRLKVIFEEENHDDDHMPYKGSNQLDNKNTYNRRRNISS